MVLDASTETGLKKTSAEKLILRNINALEQSIVEETDINRKKQLQNQLNELKAHLHGYPRDQTTLETPEATSKTPEESPVSEGKLSRLYRVLLDKHSELINEHEVKTVGEIKSLVSRDDLTIQGLVKDFSYENYRFESHYIQAAEKAYNYVVENITFVELDLNISFWLSPKEIASSKIGDDEDQAVFLCSLLFALGDETADVVVAELENGNPHAFVISEFNNKFLLLDPTQGKPFREFYGEKNEVLGKYSFNNSHIKKFLYRFNHSKYEQFEFIEE